MLLRDEQLVALVTGPDQMVTGFPADVQSHLEHDAYSAFSPVQPSSVDLHVGKIIIPGTNQDDAPDRDCFRLPPGHAIIIVTHEMLSMPASVGAAAFSLAGRRQPNVLMLNPGHIDPGYRGNLWFSFINVGHEDYEFRKGMRVATTLFWKLDGDATAPFFRRYGDGDYSKAPPAVVQGLSADTLMVDDRARQVAAGVIEESKKEFEEIRSGMEKLRNWTALLGTILPVLVVAIIGWADGSFGKTAALQEDLTTTQIKLSQTSGYVEQLKDLSTDVESLRTNVASLNGLLVSQRQSELLNELKNKLDQLEGRLAELERLNR
ncbi:MAG: hypothetical protein GC159_16230 [Phycisphaera sp.]|nr:hypothetical protein [Phycisphaera sp.]